MFEWTGNLKFPSPAKIHKKRRTKTCLNFPYNLSSGFTTRKTTETNGPNGKEGRPETRSNREPKHTARRVEKCFIKIYSLHRSDDCWLLALSSLCDILALFMWHVQCRYVIKLLSCLVIDASSRGCVFFMTLDHHFLVVIIASFHFLFFSLSLFQAAIFHLSQSAKKSADDVNSAHTECLSERTLSHRTTLTIPKW